MVGMEEGLFPHSRSLESDDDLEEERRICYVGMTRAQEFLYLSHVSSRNLFGSSQYMLSSRFLDEIPDQFINRISPKPTWKEEDANQDEGFDFDAKQISIPKRSFSSPVNVRRADLEREVARHIGPVSAYRIGSKIKHPIFGVGTVRASEGQAEGHKLTIVFSNGDIKKILTKYVQLEVM